MGDTDHGGPVTDELVNVGAIIEGHDAASVALISRGRSTTYGELQRARWPGSAAAWPRSASGAATRVALACGRTVVTSSWAIWRWSGSAPSQCPLNPASPSAELQGELAVVGARRR